MPASVIQPVRWDRSCGRAWSSSSLMTWRSTVSRPRDSPSIANPCQEGHQTKYLDGLLEEMADVMVNGVRRKTGR